MLVLTRRPGESLVIGNQVTVTVLEVRGDQIRIGIDAPRDVQIHREEVYRELETENAHAAASARRARELASRVPGAGPSGPGPNRHPGAPPARRDPDVPQD